MTVKRSLAAIFALSMIFASVSCGNDTPEADSSTGSQESESKDENNTVRHFSGVYSARLQEISFPELYSTSNLSPIRMILTKHSAI